jgi:F-box interacting protein
MATPELEKSSEIPRDVLQEILLKLPTADVARSCCVSRLWRDSVRDPSFRELHAKASHVISTSPETLLVSEKRKHDCTDEAGVFNVSSGKALRRVAILGGYVLANVCNGFLCFAHGGDGLEAPALVCNPATGETVRIPCAPPLLNCGDITNLFALGFSPPTNQYKLFRLSSNQQSKWVYVDVYTLGGSAGEWRNQMYPHPTVCHPTAEIWAPLLIDGKLYVATLPWKTYYNKHPIPKSILVIDVCTETFHTYSLPSYHIYSSDDRHPMSAFELSGQLCFAVHTSDNRLRPAIHFWVSSWSSPPPEEKQHYDTDRLLNWDLCYSFHIEGYDFSGLPCAGWLSDNGMLYYTEGSTLHKYDTSGQHTLTNKNDKDNKDKDEDADNNDLLQWEQRVDLPTTPLLSGCRWPNIYGGYRPTLLSPLTLLHQDDVNDENRYQLEHAVLRTLYDARSKPNTSSQFIDLTN